MASISPARAGRFLRLRFNSVPMDQPGRYFYLRDQDSGDYWSASWQPVGKALDAYQSTCRHGTAYTMIEARYAGIHSEATYFVPLGQAFEYWRLKVTNESDRPRRLAVFSYCEFTNQWNTQQDQVNLQYSLFIVKGGLTGDGLLRIAIHDNLTPEPGQRRADDIGMHAWLALVGAPLAGYDTSREASWGRIAATTTRWRWSEASAATADAYGDNACGSVQADLVLQPGESRELLVMLGIGDAHTLGRRAVAEYGSLERAEAELARLKQSWHSKLGSLVVETPDPDFNHTVNVWGLYNSLITFAWSRAASLVYNGERDGLGFRDSVQDILGVVGGYPRRGAGAAGADAHRPAGQRRRDAHRQALRAPARPGAAPRPTSMRSDDCLWFFNAVPAYVAETGDFDFYSEVLPYADRGGYRLRPPAPRAGVQPGAQRT
jgi:N,N'-diacetylchitobiose phosphorylase